MAGLNMTVSMGVAAAFSPAIHRTKGEATGAQIAPLESRTAAPQDETAINFGGIEVAPPAVRALQVEEPGDLPSTTSNALQTAAEQSGLTLTPSGSLAVLQPALPVGETSAPGKPFSLRQPDLDAIKVPAETVAVQNVVFMNNPSEVEGYFHRLMGDKTVRLATAGYSAPPEGYEAPTTKFLTGLAAELSGDVGFLTSPTADKGSIDAITSLVGQRAGAPLGYVTADAYLGYVNPENFPADIDRSQFASQPKFAFPDTQTYSKGTAELSNSFLVTGGRNASVSDFQNAVLNGNQVVVLTNTDVKSGSWDSSKSRVDNASAYLHNMISGNTEGIPSDHPFNQDVSKFLADNKDAVARLVRFVDAKDPGGVAQAAEHLRG